MEIRSVNLEFCVKRLLLLLSFVLFSMAFKTNATLITQDLTVSPNSDPILTGEGSALFFVLPSFPSLNPSFNPFEMRLGFANNSTANRVEVTEISSNGVITRTSSQIQTTITRMLQSVMLISFENLQGFTEDRVTQNNGVIAIDFSSLPLNTLSSIVLSFSFSSDSTEEILSSTSETLLAANSSASGANPVSSPSVFILLLVSLLALLVRPRFLQYQKAFLAV